MTVTDISESFDGLCKYIDASLDCSNYYFNNINKDLIEYSEHDATGG